MRFYWSWWQLLVSRLSERRPAHNNPPPLPSVHATDCLFRLPSLHVLASDQVHQNTSWSTDRVYASFVDCCLEARETFNQKHISLWCSVTRVSTRDWKNLSCLTRLDVSLLLTQEENFGGWVGVREVFSCVAFASSTPESLASRRRPCTWCLTRTPRAVHPSPLSTDVPDFASLLRALGLSGGCPNQKRRCLRCDMRKKKTLTPHLCFAWSKRGRRWRELREEFSFLFFSEDLRYCDLKPSLCQCRYGKGKGWFGRGAYFQDSKQRTVTNQKTKITKGERTPNTYECLQPHYKLYQDVHSSWVEGHSVKWSSWVESLRISLWLHLCANSKIFWAFKRRSRWQ